MQNYHVDNPAAISEGRHMINPTKESTMPRNDGSQSHAATHIRGAIDALLNAHTSACMYQSNGHPTYMESVPANLENAMRCINAAMADAKKQIPQITTKEKT
jgi:hypothetical protein